MCRAVRHHRTGGRWAVADAAAILGMSKQLGSQPQGSSGAITHLPFAVLDRLHLVTAITHSQRLNSSCSLTSRELRWVSERKAAPTSRVAALCCGAIKQPWAALILSLPELRARCIPEYSVNDKLREIDVANENVHGSIDYTGKVSFFKCSAAYSKMVAFLARLNTAVQGKTMRQLRGDDDAAAQPALPKVQIFASDAAKASEAADDQQKDAAAAASAPKAEPTPASILAIEALLQEVEALIAECPPADKAAPVVASAPGAAPAPSSGAGPSSRFGSPAFRDFLTLLQERAPAMVERVLASVPAEVRAQNSFDVDAPQSAQSAQWQAEGHKTLREFKRAHAKDGAHGHSHHHGHKLPPGVVISHGPSGVGNPPAAAAAAAPADSKHEHEHCDGHEHEHEHEHASDAAAAAAAPCETIAAPLDMSPSAKHGRTVSHLVRYLVSSWGDIRRLDYGTGHELNFMCFLAALECCGVFDAQSDLHATRIIGRVFARYVRLMRRLQTGYWLEPAGSRGVWGLDDYSFLPFLFGSSQLRGHKNIRPKSVRYPEILDGFAGDYLYLEAIQFILGVKTCSFAEHSPMLNDITIIKTCQTPREGMRGHSQWTGGAEAAAVASSSQRPSLSLTASILHFHFALARVHCLCSTLQGTR